MILRSAAPRWLHATAAGLLLLSTGVGPLGGCRRTEASSSQARPDGEIELGPVNATIHKVDECVSIADLQKLPDLYEAICARMLRAPTGG